MFSWIKDSASSIGSWLGDGIGSFFEWLFGGLATIVNALVNGVAAVGDTIEGIWNFAIGFKDIVLEFVTLFFPFLPAPVATALSLSMFAVLLVGIIKFVRKG